MADRLLQAVARQRSAQPQLQQVERILAEQRGKPLSVEARSVDDQVETVYGFEVFTAPVGAQREPDLLIATDRMSNTTAQVPDAVIGHQRVLHARREHSAVGA